MDDNVTLYTETALSSNNQYEYFLFFEYPVPIAPGWRGRRYRHTAVHTAYTQQLHHTVHRRGGGKRVGAAPQPALRAADKTCMRVKKWPNSVDY